MQKKNKNNFEHALSLASKLPNLLFQASSSQLQLILSDLDTVALLEMVFPVSPPHTAVRGVSSVLSALPELFLSVSSSFLVSHFDAHVSCPFGHLAFYFLFLLRRKMNYIQRPHTPA